MKCVILVYFYELTNIIREAGKKVIFFLMARPLGELFLKLEKRVTPKNASIMEDWEPAVVLLRARVPQHPRLHLHHPRQHRPA